MQPTGRTSYDPPPGLRGVPEVPGKKRMEGSIMLLLLGLVNLCLMVLGLCEGWHSELIALNGVVGGTNFVAGLAMRR